MIVTAAVIGTPVLAVGITLSRPFEMAGAALLAGALLGFSAWSLAVVVPLLSAPARVWLALSALSLPASMVLAVLYAWGRVAGCVIVEISTLATVHGSLNALGFGLCGLVGWTVAARHLRPSFR